MNQLFFTGVGLLAIMLSWRYMVVVSLRDRARDKLKVLRNRVEMYFDRHGTQASDVANVRRSLLGLLDAEINQMHDFSIVGVIAHRAWSEEHPEAYEAMREQINAKFATNDDKIAAFATKIRRESALVLMDYVSRKYLTVWILATIALPFVALHQGSKRLSVMLNQAFREVMTSGARILRTNGNVQQTIEESFLRPSR
ncbi:hypothetical protein [Burkholderia gladioli]|uniref:hypothetical protein n=1 Tax=Burkholderia gladioli TaxID=28095 RepID=UPI0016420366|nr:hypothetical protein [Burkholderia gladioli]